MAPAPRRLTEVNQLSHCRYRFSRWVHIAAHPRSARTRSSYSAIAGGGLWPRDPVALMQVAIARLYPRPTEIARVYPGPPEIVRDGARSRDPVGPRAARQRAALVHAPRARAALRLRAAALQGAAAAARRGARASRGARRAASGSLGRSRAISRRGKSLRRRAPRERVARAPRPCLAASRAGAGRGRRRSQPRPPSRRPASKRRRRICWTRCVWRCRVRAPLSSGGCSARSCSKSAGRPASVTPIMPSTASTKHAVNAIGASHARERMPQPRYHPTTRSVGGTSCGRRHGPQ